jgi:hypothetical protein
VILDASSTDATNAVLRHGTAHERDYRPVKRPFPYDMAAAQVLIQELDYSVAV